MKISDIRVTPVAFPDPPLLNSVGVHSPLVHRVVVRLTTSDGTVGYGECAGGAQRLARLNRAATALTGLPVHDTSRMEAVIGAELPELSSTERASVFSPFEVAALDIQGKLAGVPVVDLIGGRVRDQVPFSAYLFYKWAEHPALDGRAAIGDEWGEALDPDGIVRQARRMIDLYGFGSIKLKGGVMEPDAEVEAIEALRDAFPTAPLRLDPNAVWSVETSIRIARRTEGLLEYLEDPASGQADMAAVAKVATMPLATNMCVVAFDQIRSAVEIDAVQVILGDHHYWGGLRRTRDLGAVCETFGLGLSMHSNSHLGISLAAMVHVAAATPILTYACDTHYPWNGAHDVVRPGTLAFRDGAVAVPPGPGLGIEVDEDQVAALHERYLSAGTTDRDDTGYMRRFVPDYDTSRPRW